MTLLAIEGLTIGAHVGGRQVAAVRDLSLDLEAGRILGVVGESGAGKSMIGRAIAGALPPSFSIDAGRILLDGEDLARAAPSRMRALRGQAIGFVPQEPMAALNPVMSVGAQFSEHLGRLGIPRRDRARQAAAMLAAVHLPDPQTLLRRYPHELSGGMCQRVLIAMAFAGRPRLVVADEPTTALDVTIQARIAGLIAEMQRRDGTAMLFITHDLRLAARICDEVLVLYAGQAVERGPGTMLLRRPAHPYTRSLQLAAPAMAGPPRALQALPDRMPGLIALADMRGCRFSARCPVGSADCAQDEPQAAARGTVACLHPERTAAIAPTAAAPRPPPAPGAPVLVLDGLARRYGHVDAVLDASFAIGAGEFVGLVGESGSGKSTIARLVMGLVPPSAGRIVLGGRDVTAGRRADRRHRADWAQMVFQDPQSALNPGRRVATIATQAMEAAGRPRAERQLRAATLLQEVGLAAEIGARLPAQLSGGQRQRVNIARALCTVPRLLIADEIVSGLDVSIQAQLLDLLARLRQERGVALLLISHDLSVVRHLCERVLVMHRGVIVEEGRTEAVFAQPSHPYTRRLLAAVPPDDPTLPWQPFAEPAERPEAA